MVGKRPWYRSSGYKHLDAQVGEAFATKTAQTDFVAAHAWLPLIAYVKRVKRYKAKDGKTIFKDRPIMYASHRDACILKRYALQLSQLLDEYYLANGLNDSVI